MSYLHDTLQDAIDRAIPSGEIFDNVFRDALESLCLALQDQVPIRVLLDGLGKTFDGFGNHYEEHPFLRVMLDASFAHVPQHELEALEAMASNPGIRIGNFHGQVTWGDCNALVNLNVGLPADATEAEVAAAWDVELEGVSEGLAGLIRMAVAHGADWLNLDRDGQLYDLPIYVEQG
ncbi:hypothetical protein [Dyella ginsengisoli]|uniref:DUF5983 family protein n=1 Tax=Dyella ginsengisoli TaxID=363848 RepID=UPI00034B6003|nr:hypothetical protein [Dyella ginsengisoli]